MRQSSVAEQATVKYGRAFFDYFLEKNILGQILELLGMPRTPKEPPMQRSPA